MPTFGSLFAGIGGIDLGLERAGWECRFQVEWDAYCQRVLAKHWPDVPRYGDITTVDWSGVERVDLLAGGFPCQPFSLAGQRRGKSDDRWLWPAFAAAIRALRPRYVLVENVPGLLAGHGGMGTVLGDLAELGYDTEWDSVPAAAVGAPHLRYRVWIVAHAHDVGGLGVSGVFDSFGPSFGDDADGCDSPVPYSDSEALRNEPVTVTRRGGPSQPGLDGALRSMADADYHDVERTEREPSLDGRTWLGGSGALADPDDAGLQGLTGSALPEREAPAGHGWPSGVGDSNGASADAHPATSRPRRAAGEPGWWATEPDVGRVAHGVPSRVDRLRALGNAVVPQVVEVIGQRLLEVMP